jgi:RNA polymerase sigma factor (sigma-70 family)
VKKNEVHEHLVRLRNGDENAAVPLVGIFHLQFYERATGHYKLSHDEADEAIQCTYIKMLERIQQYKPERAGGSSWVWRIFTNTVRDILRQKTRQQLREQQLELTEDFAEALAENIVGHEGDDFKPEVYVEWLEIGEAIQQTLEQTPQPVIQELFAERGSRGPKRKSLEDAELCIRKIFNEVYPDE